jgi:hypothetical protein
MYENNNPIAVDKLAKITNVIIPNFIISAFPPVPPNRYDERHHVPCKQREPGCVVRDIRSTTLLWRFEAATKKRSD